MAMSPLSLREIDPPHFSSSWMLSGNCCSSSPSHLSLLRSFCTGFWPTLIALSSVWHSLLHHLCLLPLYLPTLSLFMSGTFLYDTPQERHRHRLKTCSLWAHLAQPNVAGPLTNPLYDRNSSVLVLSVSHLTVVSSLSLTSIPSSPAHPLTVTVAPTLCARASTVLSLSAWADRKAVFETEEQRVT